MYYKLNVACHVLDDILSYYISDSLSLSLSLSPRLLGVAEVVLHLRDGDAELGDLRFLVLSRLTVCCFMYRIV